MKVKVTVLCAICAMLAVLAFFSVMPLGVQGHQPQSKKTTAAKPKQLDSQDDAREKSQLPKVRSLVDGVSLQNVRLSEDGQWVEYEIINNTPRALMSVTLRSGANAKVINAYGDEILLQPGQGYDKSSFQVSKLEEDNLTISAVVYADGEMVGAKKDVSILQHMKKRKDEGKAPKAVKNQPGEEREH